MNGWGFLYLEPEILKLMADLKIPLHLNNAPQKQIRIRK